MRVSADAFGQSDSDRSLIAIAGDRLVYHSLTVGAGYECDPQKVLDILLQVARQHPRVLKVPSPIAFFIGFGESSLDFELKFWLDNPLIGKTKRENRIKRVRLRKKQTG
jgi:small-conductance mechanosensitive channel